MEKINILASGNDTYSFATKVFLISLLENRINRNVDIYFLYNKLSMENRTSIMEVVRRYSGCDIIFIEILPNMFEGVPLKATTNEYITVETYFRMAINEVLPMNISKILYLDTDIIVNKPFTELYDKEFDDDMVAYVCEDYGIRIATKIRKHVFSNLGFEDDYTYFNAGVLLLNMKYIQKYFPFSVFKKFIKEYRDKLIFHDQDVLNYLFKGRVKYLDYHIFNCRPFYFEKSKRREKIILDTSVIIHYGEKPWNDDFYDMCGDVFWKYANSIEGEEARIKHQINNNIYIKANKRKLQIKIVKRNIKAFIMSLMKGKY